MKLKVEGPLDEKEGSIGFLKRSFKSTHEGEVEITMNSKYIEGLIEVLKLEGAYPKRLPCPSDNGRSFQAKKDGMNPLSAEDHHTYRKRSWYTLVSSAREARYHVCVEEAFYEASSTS